MQRITPYLWFDKEAGEAAKFYVSVFKDGKIRNVTKMEGTPSGTVEIVEMEISGLAFRLMSAGPYFTFNPSISFLVACDSREEVDSLWKALSEKGKALMELGDYPFSERYGWIQDRYGVSWQLMFMGGKKYEQKITTTLMFVGDNCGKAEKAIAYYVSMFENSKIGDIMRYGEGEEPDANGTVKHAEFTIAGQAFAAMDSAYAHDFAFSEAISLEVGCRNQEEIDRFWKLSADPSAEQCGWLKDKYGLSWQIVPTVLGEMLADKDAGKVARVTEAFLAMKKFDLAALNAAYKG